MYLLWAHVFFVLMFHYHLDYWSWTWLYSCKNVFFSQFDWQVLLLTEMFWHETIAGNWITRSQSCEGGKGLSCWECKVTKFLEKLCLLSWRDCFKEWVWKTCQFHCWCSVSQINRLMIKRIWNFLLNLKMWL